MFHHVTLIRFRPDSPPDATAGALDAARDLEQAIPSVLAMRCGEAVRAEAHSWQMAFEFSFADRAGFDAFVSHEEHEAFIHRHIHPHLEEVVSVDDADGSGDVANFRAASAASLSQSVS